MADRSRSRSRSRSRDDAPADTEAAADATSDAPAAAAPAGKLTGTVVTWRGDRGFGFIKPADGGEDLFCHHSAITDGEALPEGGTVYYESGVDDRSGKTRASNVTGGCAKQRPQGESPPSDPGGTKVPAKRPGRSNAGTTTVASVSLAQTLVAMTFSATPTTLRMATHCRKDPK